MQNQTSEIVPQRGRFGAFVMTYNRAELLPRTIRSLLTQSVPPDVILVVDNASTDNTAKVVEEMNHASVHYLRLPENVGPSGGASAGIKWAIEQGIDWVYWGDDDDPPWHEHAFERLFKTIDSYGAAEVGAIGVVGSRFDWQIGEKKRIADSELHGPVEVDGIGGGGTFLISRRGFTAVSPPDEVLFFSLEDMEYCLRMRRAGLKILVDGDQALESRRRNNRLNITTKSEVRRRWTVPLSQRPARQYYSTRNYIYMMRGTFGRPSLARREAMKALARCVISWGRGPRHGYRFTRLQLKGVFDGYRRRMGKTVPLR